MKPMQYYKFLITDKPPPDNKILRARHQLIRHLGVKKQIELIKLYPGLFIITSLISPTSTIPAKKIDSLFKEDCNWLSYIEVNSISGRQWTYMLRKHFKNTKYHCTWKFSGITWKNLAVRDPLYIKLYKYADDLNADTIDQYVIMAEMEL